MKGELALLGGAPAVPAGFADPGLVGWPVVTEAEHAALRDVLDKGLFTSNDGGRGEVAALEREWADHVGVAHCAAVSNGTAAIELVLAALDVEPGSEVLVPALTFIASAVAPVARMLVPVFVDIDPVTFLLDPVAVEAAITPRTRVILAVHLHGLPCELTELRAIARRHGLFLIEDAAQAQDATYRGMRVGGFGDAATVSLNATKNLPTCGEGGLVTTDDAELHRKVVLHRQFGEDLRGGQSRDYLSRVLAGNEKLSAVQAAFTRCQLARLDGYTRARDHNVRRLLDRVGGLPGTTWPSCPPDRTHAWYILRTRFSPAALGYDDVPPAAFRDALRRVLRAEGVPVQPYQQLPLPAQPAFQELAGYGGYPWRLPGVSPPDYRAANFPVTCQVLDDSLTLQRWHLSPAAGPVLDRCADAFEKVWDNLDAVVAVARARPRSRSSRTVAR